MGLVDLTSVEIKDSGPSFDKFDVEKNDKALIHIPNNEVVQEFVHVFHREEPTMIERNGRKVPEWTRESFAGTFICTGDFETVLASPSYGDPSNCPACRAMNKTPKLVERPKRTFALNVVRYATNRRSYELRNNNVEVQVWRHADVRKLEPILNAARELAQNGEKLNSVDFCVEADNSDWKKYMITPSLAKEPAFRGNDTLKANMKEAYTGLFPTEQLVEACGRKLDSEALDAEISRLVAEHRLEAEQDSDSELFTAASSTSDSTNTDTSAVTAKTTEDDLTTLPMDELDDINALFE